MNQSVQSVIGQGDLLRHSAISISSELLSAIYEKP